MVGKKQKLINLDKDNNQKFVHLLAIGHWSQICLFPRWIEYMLPTNNYVFRAISKSDKNGEFEALTRKSYYDLVSLPTDACTTKEAKRELAKEQPLIVTTDIRFPQPYDDHSKQSGLELVLRHRDLSPIHIIFFTALNLPTKTNLS